VLKQPRFHSLVVHVRAGGAVRVVDSGTLFNHHLLACVALCWLSLLGA
jgi:hypothetical protein